MGYNSLLAFFDRFKNSKKIEMKQKIFVSAYACEPGLGSEIGVGWHWVLEMSREFELWVLTRESNRGSIEPWVAAHPEFSGIHFLYFDLPKWARFWKKGLRGVRTYYNIWQKLTDRIVKRTMRENDIKVFHHLTYGNAMWPVSSYGSRQTFIWGPIGGLETIPEDYSRHYGKKAALIERVRRIAVRRIVASRAFKKRCRRADLIICKTELTQNLLPSNMRDKSVLMTDVAADIKTKSIKATAHNCVNFLAVGRLDAWRGFDIAILAFAEASKKNSNTHLTILGKGIDRERLQEIARETGVNNKVSFIGQVSPQKYEQFMADADVVLNPSLKEGAVTVSFDAMALGKPLIAIDTTGYTRNFSLEHSIIIPREERTLTISAFADAMLRLANNADLRSTMGEKAYSAARKCSWDYYGRAIRTLINEQFR